MKVRIVPVLVMERDGKPPVITFDARWVLLHIALIREYAVDAETGIVPKEIAVELDTAQRFVEENRENLLPIGDTEGLQTYLTQIEVLAKQASDPKA
jgi:hypothetical protein